MLTGAVQLMDGWIIEHRLWWCNASGSVCQQLGVGFQERVDHGGDLVGDATYHFHLAAKMRLRLLYRVT
jgi:hypothetical protein